MTQEQIKQDENFLCGLEIPAKSIRTDSKAIAIYLVFIGSANLQYYMFLDGKILFDGTDFKPSPLHGIDTLEVICSLLSFLTLKKGNTDPEYFKDYTPEQWEWSESPESEELSMYVGDIENDDSEYYDSSKEFFDKYFID